MHITSKDLNDIYTKKSNVTHSNYTKGFIFNNRAFLHYREHIIIQYTRLRLDNTGAWAIEVYSSLLCNWVSEHIDLHIKLKLVIFSFI